MPSGETGSNNSNDGSNSPSPQGATGSSQQLPNILGAAGLTGPAAAPVNYTVNAQGVTGPAPSIVNYTLDETIDVSGAVIHNVIGSAADGSEVVQTTFVTNDVSGAVVKINENLLEVVYDDYDNTLDVNSPTNVALNQIKLYASKIQCEDFHGKGTVEDYSELFRAASKIANDAKRMQLDVDIDGFNDFANAADNLSALFTSFTVKLQSVSVVDDLAFLQAIAAALAKIWNLSEVFGKFQKTILVTSSVMLPKSSHDAASTIQNVMSEVNCAMNYINHFVSPSAQVPSGANLSASDKNIINKAVYAVDNWSTLCNMGVTIAMANDPDVIYISTINNQLKAKTLQLNSNTSLLQSTLVGFNIRL